MQKKGLVIVGIILISIFLISSVSFASAGWFSNLFGKITEKSSVTGNVVSGSTSFTFNFNQNNTFYGITLPVDGSSKTLSSIFSGAPASKSILAALKVYIYDGRFIVYYNNGTCWKSNNNGNPNCADYTFKLGEGFLVLTPYKSYSTTLTGSDLSNTPITIQIKGSSSFVGMPGCAQYYDAKRFVEEVYAATGCKAVAHYIANGSSEFYNISGAGVNFPITNSEALQIMWCDANTNAAWTPTCAPVTPPVININNLVCADNKFTLKTTISDGALTLPLFYVDGLNVLGIGEKSTHQLVTNGVVNPTTGAITLYLEETENSYFVVTWINGGTFESYAYEIESITSDNGNNATILKNLADGSDISFSRVGDDKDKGNINFVLTSANDNSKHAQITLSASIGRLYLNKLKTPAGLEISLPSYVNFTHGKVHFDTCDNLSRDSSCTVSSPDKYIECGSVQPTCSDSDGGLNYYVKGNTTDLMRSKIDNCFNDGSNMLAEYYCSATVLPGYEFNEQINFNCPNGCANGACIRPENCSDGFDFSLVGGGVRSFVADAKTYDIRIDYMDNSNVVLVINGIYTPMLKEGNTYYLGNSILEISKILNIDRVDHGNSSVNIIIHTNCPANTPQTCQDLIDSVKSPKDLVRPNWDSNGSVVYSLRYNDSQSITEWINNKEETGRAYYASWSNNAGNNNYEYIDYSIRVFDNLKINLSSLVKGFDNSGCYKENWGNDFGAYYLCLYSNADSVPQQTNNYGYNSVDVIWFNKNVFYKFSYSVGGMISDEEILRMGNIKIINLLQQIKNDDNLMNQLVNNQYRSSSNQNNQDPLLWKNLSFNFAEFFLEKAFASCKSEVDTTPSSRYGSNSYCKTEPVICPPHGRQTETCQYWNNEIQDYDTQTYDKECSPGICSGCMTPKWLGGSDNKCVPYGFRFAQQNGWTYEITQFSESHDMPEGRTSSNDFNIDYMDANKVVIRTAWNNATYTLRKGDTTNLDLSGLGEEELLSAKMTVKDILYSAKEGATNKVVVTFNILVNQKVPSTFNAYCDIDGQISQQKVSSAGEWAKCQNNYECFSNLCSGGECVDLQALAKDANAFKATFVKVICKFANLFDENGYNQCLVSYLG